MSQQLQSLDGGAMSSMQVCPVVVGLYPSQLLLRSLVKSSKMNNAILDVPNRPIVPNQTVLI